MSAGMKAQLSRGDSRCEGMKAQLPGGDRCINSKDVYIESVGVIDLW
jgi:hypothetical protein